MSGGFWSEPPWTQRGAWRKDLDRDTTLSRGDEVGLQEEGVHRLVEDVAVLTHERRTGTGRRFLMAAYAQPNAGRV
jgi:hypothetical protein